MNDWLWSIDWRPLLVPQYSVAEMVLRGSLMYLLIFALLRLVLKRQLGGIGTSDILVIVLVSEVAGNGFTAADYKSVTEGAILVCTVLGWSTLFNWLQHRFPLIERLLREPKLKLIENGRMLRRNMNSELVTVEELMTQLREEGLEDCKDVKSAYMEADGHISVIRKEK